MHRRNFVRSIPATAAAAWAGRLKPVRADTPQSRVLRFVPQSDLVNFDPIGNVALLVRNAAMLVWDTLYGVDATLTPRRQMVEAEQVSPDGLVWTFRLREGLAFHDGEPVLARDVVASLDRWTRRDPIGQMIKAREEALAVVDDRTLRWTLKRPFPKMLLALGKVATPCCFIMPERIASTDPFKPIRDFTGSGPARFVSNEWVAGHRVVFERFPAYRPRPEPSSWAAGSKLLSVDRIEWHVIADPATAAAALQGGEVDWWERTLPDLVPSIRADRRLSIMDADPFGYLGLLVINHLHPPFNDVRARRALLMAIDQKTYIDAFAGSDGADWRPMAGYFAPGSQFHTEQGSAIFKGPRDLEAARRLMREAGYHGEPIVCMAAQDIAAHKVWGEVTMDLLQQLGMKAELAALDWGTVVARRSQKAPPGKGGWHLHHNGVFASDTIDPTQKWIRAAGDQALNGWANSAVLEAEAAAWFESASAAEETSIAARLNEAALDDVIYAPLGIYMSKYSFRRSLSGVSSGPMPFFWNVVKSG